MSSADEAPYRTASLIDTGIYVQGPEVYFEFADDGLPLHVRLTRAQMQELCDDMGAELIRTQLAL